MVEIANVRFHTCAIATAQIPIFLLATRLHLYFSFDIATVLLWNFVNQQILNKVRKRYTLCKTFIDLRKLFRDSIRSLYNADLLFL